MDPRTLPIKKRIAEHEEFIMKNIEFFDSVFSPSNWRRLTLGKINDNPGSIYMTKSRASHELIIVGSILRSEFDYNQLTSPLNIVLHFKRVYNSLTKNV